MDEKQSSSVHESELQGLMDAKVIFPKNAAKSDACAEEELLFSICCWFCRSASDVDTDELLRGRAIVASPEEDSTSDCWFDRVSVFRTVIDVAVEVVGCRWFERDEIEETDEPPPECNVDALSPEIITSL